MAGAARHFFEMLKLNGRDPRRCQYSKYELARWRMCGGLRAGSHRFVELAAQRDVQSGDRNLINLKIPGTRPIPG